MPICLRRFRLMVAPACWNLAAIPPPPPAPPPTLLRAGDEAMPLAKEEEDVLFLWTGSMMAMVLDLREAALILSITSLGRASLIR